MAGEPAAELDDRRLVVLVVEREREDDPERRADDERRQEEERLETAPVADAALPELARVRLHGAVGDDLLQLALDEDVEEGDVAAVAGVENQTGALGAAADGDQLVADLLGEASGVEEVDGALFLLFLFEAMHMH